MKMKIRGIMVDTLVQSGLVPILDSLVANWQGNTTLLRKRIIDVRLPGIVLRISLWALIGILLVVPVEEGIYTVEVLSVLVLFSVAILMDAALVWPVCRFTSAVNKLDSLLLAHGFQGGIASLPCGSALDVVIGLIQRRALQIRELEVDPDISLEFIESKRTEMRELASLLRKDFCLDVGSFAPMFAEADKKVAQAIASKGPKNGQSAEQPAPA